MDSPCVLIASTTDFDPKELVKQMLGTPGLPTAKPVLEQIEAYPWHIDTKYYTADINICTTPTRTIGNEEFAENVQGFVLYFDASEENGLQKIGFWLPFVKEMEPAVQILVCERCLQNGVITKLESQKWCLENGFELVELNPEQDSSDSEEDDFQETTGVQRIVQALHAHTWPNLVMKDKPTFRSPYMTQMMMDSAREQIAVQSRNSGESNSSNEASAAAGDVSSLAASLHSISINDSTHPAVPNNQSDLSCAADSANAQTDNAAGLPEATLEGATANPGASSRMSDTKAEKDKKNQQKKSGIEIIDSMVPDSDMALFAALGNEDPAEESFEQLFEKMRLMKERAENLPPQQRKQYAEKVAIQFWRAIGGDEEEIDGLSSEDEQG